MGGSLFSGCDLFRHIQHMDPPVIDSSLPEENDVVDADLPAIEIHFSTGMDTVATEQAFSLQEEGEDLDGEFSWEGDRLIFTPYYGFSDNRDYLVTLKTGAEDIWGNSLEKEWYLNFTTREDSESPELVRIAPEDFTLLQGSREVLTLEFSEGVDRPSFRKGFSLSPDILYSESWNTEGSQVEITPLEDYEEDRAYTVSLSREILDLAGNPLLREEEFLFYTGEVPEPLTVSFAVSETGTELVEEPQGVNSSLEKDLILRAVFNRSLSADEREAAFSILPSTEFETSWTSGFTECTLSFPESLSYGGYYDFTLLETVYILHIDGPGSLPLTVNRAVFCPDGTAGTPVMNPLSLNSSLGAQDSTTAFLDLYIAHSGLSAIDRSSVLNAFSLDSSVLSWDYYSLDIWDGSQSPAPDPLPVPGESVIRIHTGVTWTGLGGTLTLKLSEALEDTLGNSQESPWTLTVSQL